MPKRQLILVAVAALLFARAAAARTQFDGLDLTDSKPAKSGEGRGRKAEPAKDKGKGSEKTEATGLEGLDLSGTTSPASTGGTGDAAGGASPASERSSAGEGAAATETPAASPRAALGPVGERDTTRDDRVKSVQRKLYMKRHRFELAPSVSYNVNDPYFDKFGLQARAAWYPADTLAVALRFALVQNRETADVRTAVRNFQSRIFQSQPRWVAAADLEWSPFYGKVAFLNSILHFDGYLVAGAGAVSTAATSLTPCFDFGVGMRFVARDWLAVNVTLVNTTYTEVPSGTIKASLQNLMMASAGVSFFLPLKSTYREAE